MPEHVGIILDGNRRWAWEKQLTIEDGHFMGAKGGEELLDWTGALGIKTLTLHVFSTENFERQNDEVNGLLKLIEGERRRLGSDRSLHSTMTRGKILGR